MVYEFKEKIRLIKMKNDGNNLLNVYKYDRFCF